MKKQLLLTTMVLAMGTAYADNEALERAKDHAQPIPNASVTTHTVTENTTITESGVGTAINTTKAVSVNNSETGHVTAVEETSGEVILPEGRIIDNQMNLSQTIKRMKEIFAKLQAESTVAGMQKQAYALTEYAGQASVLIERGEQNQLVNPQQAIADLNQLRGLLIELNRALETNDLTLAKTKVDVIAQAQDGFYGNFNP